MGGKIKYNKIKARENMTSKSFFNLGKFDKLNGVLLTVLPGEGNATFMQGKIPVPR